MAHVVRVFPNKVIVKKHSDLLITLMHCFFFTIFSDLVELKVCLIYYLLDLTFGLWPLGKVTTFFGYVSVLQVCKICH